MNAFKGIVMIVLVISIFSMILLPMESGTFPAWMSIDIIEFMLVLLCVVCALVLVR